MDVIRGRMESLLTLQQPRKCKKKFILTDKSTGCPVNLLEHAERWIETTSRIDPTAYITLGATLVPIKSRLPLANRCQSVQVDKSWSI